MYHKLVSFIEKTLNEYLPFFGFFKDLTQELEISPYVVKKVRNQFCKFLLGSNLQDFLFFSKFDISYSIFWTNCKNFNGIVAIVAKVDYLSTL